MNEKLLSLLGLARRARRLSCGFEAVSGAIKTKRARLVLVAAGLSPKTVKEIRYLCEKHGVPARAPGFTMQELSHAVGFKSGVAALDDAGFAQKALTLCNNDGEE